jgi:hypothetical protein
MFQHDNEYLPSRSTFERNFNFLGQHLKEDKVQFSYAGARLTVLSLKRIRFLPNSRIDLNTINELARSTANAIAQMQHYQNIEQHDEE